MKTIAAIICVLVFLLVLFVIFYRRRRRRRRTQERLAREFEEIYLEMARYGVNTIEDLEAVKAQERQELELAALYTQTSADECSNRKTQKRSKS